MEDSAVSDRRRSGRSADATARAEALQRLKELRRSGGRSGAGIGFQIKLEEPIYDTVDEKDYARIVAERREAARGFIVDDNGMGYDDLGEEVDWAEGGLPPSSDEDADSDGSKRNKKNKKNKKDPPLKKPAPTSLTAAAALMGKQKLSAMFASTGFRKSEKGNGSCLSSESILDDLIAECAPDEADREERRARRVGPTAVVARSFVAAPVSMIKEQLETCLPKNYSQALQIPPSEDFQANDDLGPVKEPMQFKEEALKCESGAEADMHDNLGQSSCALHVKSDPVVSNEKVFALNAKVQVKEEGSESSATADWKAVCVDSKLGASEVTEIDEKSEFELDSDGSLNFYLIDVHEESFGANAGTVYLFGKVFVMLSVFSRTSPRTVF